MFKILLVDDTKSIHAFVKDLLKKKTSVIFRDVFNGQEAIDCLFDSQEKFDLILLDWEMPIKTGPETLMELKKRGCDTPIVMMTTRNSPDEIAQLLEMGASEYMMKPFTADILFEKIEYVCGEGFNRAA
jgi:DNA-binding response OmpR family regulator